MGVTAPMRWRELDVSRCLDRHQRGRRTIVVNGGCSPTQRQQADDLFELVWLGYLHSHRLLHRDWHSPSGTPFPSSIIQPGDLIKCAMLLQLDGAQIVPHKKTPWHRGAM